MSAGLRKTTRPIFTKFGGKLADESRKKPIDFGGNPDHVTLGLKVKVGYSYG